MIDRPTGEGFAGFVRELEARWGEDLGDLVIARCIDSTNLLARRFLEQRWRDEAHCPEVTFFAFEQTAGRGRLGRSWISRPGLGVYTTLLRSVPEDALQSLPLLVGVGVARALVRETGCRVGLKWPNDLQVGGRKIGGVLIESLSRDDEVAALIGVGINHGQRPADLPLPRATSLRQEVDRLPTLGKLAGDVVGGVRAELAHLRNVDYARREYGALSVHRPGESLHCRVGEQDLEGTFLGFDGRGFLRLEVDGRERMVASGEIIE